jgi:hypothetical protein
LEHGDSQQDKRVATEAACGKFAKGQQHDGNESLWLTPLPKHSTARHFTCVTLVQCVLYQMLLQDQHQGQ